jgi:2-C-methyl-D-erythritol 4-phosphate cytidylyltransferase
MMAAHGSRTVAAILVAGGSGQRLGANVPKAFVVVAGRTLLEHAMARFAGHPDITSVVVVAPAAFVGRAREVTTASVVPGGDTRQTSVAAGLAAVSVDADYVLVHDVARPFVPATVITDVVAALDRGADAVIPVLPVHDTVRRVGAAGELQGVVDRATLVAVQTPQGFPREMLVEAHAAGRYVEVTDDAALVEALGGQVVTVPGADESFKITRAWDLTVAAAVAHG